MGHADFYAPGSFNRICDRCGMKRKAYQTRKEWDGLIVCSDGCWEPRHAQDFLRGFRDRQAVPDPRPESQDAFIEYSDGGGGLFSPGYFGPQYFGGDYFGASVAPTSNDVTPEDL